MSRAFKYCKKCKKAYPYEIPGNLKTCPACDADLERDEYESEEECLAAHQSECAQSRLYLWAKVEDKEIIINIPDDHEPVGIGRAYQEGWPMNVSRRHVFVSKSEEYEDTIVVEICKTTNGTKLLDCPVEYQEGNRNYLRVVDSGGPGKVTLDATEGHGIDLILKKRG